MTEQRLAMVVIYKQPRDFPHSYVTRRHVLMPDGTTHIDPLPLAVCLASHPSALEAARLPVFGMTRIQGPGDDPDPCIWEVWI